MTHRDRPCGPSGRREVAVDAGHRQGFPTPSDGPHGRPQRRLAKAFGQGGGQRRARLAMSRIVMPRAPCMLFSCGWWRVAAGRPFLIPRSDDNDP